jgi:hypothetical protein
MLWRASRAHILPSAERVTKYPAAGVTNFDGRQSATRRTYAVGKPFERAFVSPLLACDSVS